MEKKQPDYLSAHKFVHLICICNSQPTISSQRRHFVLVHGAGHGAWCWYKITTLLQFDGHNVTALDLTASGINPRQIRDLNFSSVLDYIQPLMEFMASLKPRERVILVGHSLGGLGLSVAMERFPEKIYAAIFVTAVMPGPNLTYFTITEEQTRRLGSLLDSQYIYDQGRNNSPTALRFRPVFLASKLYQLSPPEDFSLALSLLRPFPVFTDEALVLKETKLTKDKYGSVRRVFIVCDQDLTIDEGLQRWMIERNPPTEVKVINGTDHMVMFTRPLKLFSYLGQIAEKYY
ncbi:hypothetical protein TIFTF001_002600 [Ficus carica]|uniref:(S)-hydroxynitrile lyase n=1 Tax=Ficus carica TaxID=3494 RepID=A0AA87ZV59_FICCA|nr:hypothetical protein TIFTF001_002600 [Ficus carica]